MKKNHISYTTSINIKYNNAVFTNNHLLKWKENGHRTPGSRASLNSGTDGRVWPLPPVTTQTGCRALVCTGNRMYYPLRLFRQACVTFHAPSTRR